MDDVSVTDSEPQLHKLYFNSLAQSENPITITRFEVIICDHNDNLVFKTNDGLLHYHLMTSMEADIRALLYGLAQATNLGINNISIYCRPRHPIFEYLLGRLDHCEKKIALLMDDVKVIRKQFRFSNHVMMFEEDVKFVSKLAIETCYCVVCFNNVVPDLMFSFDKCGHRFCLSCMKQHIEVKLLDRKIPSCPYHFCKSQLSMLTCGEILSPTLSLMWKQIIREDSIPFEQRIYCPYQSC